MHPVQKLEKYDKRGGYSYALGVYPSLSLLENRADCARRLLLHPDSLDGDGVQLLRETCCALNIREEYSEKVLRRESKKDNCYAALVFNKYESQLADDMPHVVLHQTMDGGNLGSIIRTCLGFGIGDIALIRPHVDEFDPHVIRATMGAFFKMRVRSYDTFDVYRREYPNHALYPFMLTGAAPLPEITRASERYALVFGNEASGLPDAFAGMGRSVYIPQSAAIDSLNLSAAVAVGLYAFTRLNASGESI